MRGRRNDAGFTLIETLVAFAIAATSLALLFRINAGSSATAVLADEYVQATTLGRSLLAEQGATERSLNFTKTGVELEKYHWRVSSQPLRTATSRDGGKPLFALREIAVEVTWQSRDKARQVELRTATPVFTERSQ
jgi:type II secretory pathway pseudopilin PulG